MDDGFAKGIAGITRQSSTKEAGEKLGIASAHGLNKCDSIRCLLVVGGLAVVARLEAAIVVGVVATRLEDGVEVGLRIHTPNDGWL